MKKVLLSIFVLVCLLILCACTRFGSQTDGTTLVCGRYMDGVLSFVDFNPDGQFEFAYKTYMSAYPSGVYEVKEGKIYATSDQVFPGDVYVFEIVDQETIQFCKEESNEIDVKSGTVYKLEAQE